MSATSSYLDHAASSPMRPVAIETLNRHLRLVGNPSALHVAGQRARRALEEARELLAQALGAHPTEVVFTSGGSEADSIAVVGGMASRRDEGRTRCLVSAIEHPAVLGMTERGAQTLPVTRSGTVDVDAATALIDEATGVVSVMAVNNETGILQPLEPIRRAARAAGAWFHTDAVQALGHVPLDFRDGGYDLMSVSAHKVGGPVGVGALVVRRALKPAPIGLGGGQEREIRSGTGMVALAASFAAAAVEAVAQLETEGARLRGLAAEIVALAQRCEGNVNTLAAEHAPHIVNVTFPGLRANDLLFLLDQRGIYASVGSACRAGVHQPSEVLLAMGRNADEAAATLRFSIGHSTTKQDLERLVDVLPGAVARAREAF
ncbi:cysteine desulfurase [Tessaracoccus sp. OS52]|uniref:cysteine desulfurase family protein n=1 Tax=Tessaracoccus sp. OS52 TaxID=2886691 RepID=UPI001D0FC91B|nr:cysteine desulfurase [Tessaracoccus sp. OS52]